MFQSNIVIISQNQKSAKCPSGYGYPTYNIILSLTIRKCHAHIIVFTVFVHALIESLGFSNSRVSRGKYFANIYTVIKKQSVFILVCIFDLRFYHTIKS